MEIIRRRHEENGRKYPRPRESCPECQGELVLCWGTTVKTPYWRHCSSINTKCPGTTNFGETLLHSHAKRMLVEYLNNGGVVKCECRCSRCAMSYTQMFDNKTPVALHYVNEYRMEQFGCILDIAGLDTAAEEEEEHRVVVGIEVRATHSSVASTRSGIRWIEVDATDILDLLDTENPREAIYLRDVSGRPCLRSRYCVPMLALARMMHYYTSEADEHFKYSSEIARLIDIVESESEIKGCWRSFWTLCPQKHCDIDAWDAFLRRRECMRCQHACPSVSYRKPFCHTCFRRLRREGNKVLGNIDLQRIPVDPERVKYLKEAFSWLSEIPMRQTLEDRCVKCDKLLLHDSDFISWIHTGRCICAACCEKERVARNIS
jgi:hypothetical protein